MQDKLILIFLLLFSIHELEELIWLPNWIKENKAIFPSSFERIIDQPFLKEKMIKIIFIEYVITILTSVLVWLYPDSKIIFDIWLLFTTAFFLHLPIHILQALITKKLIPSTTTSIIILILTPKYFQLIFESKNMSFLNFISSYLPLSGIILVFFFFLMFIIFRRNI